MEVYRGWLMQLYQSVSLKYPHRSKVSSVQQQQNNNIVSCKMCERVQYFANCFQPQIDNNTIAVDMVMGSSVG